MSIPKNDRFSRNSFSISRQKATSLSATKPLREATRIEENPQPISEVDLQKGVVFIYNFWLGPGNNSQLVRKILLSRGNWNEVHENERTHFKWAQNTRGYKYELFGCSGRKEMFNHFENYSELNNKATLIRNLNEYSESHRINMFTFTPPTFVINLDDMFCDKILSDFLIFYTKHHPRPIDSKQRMQQLQLLKNFIRSYGNKYKPMTHKHCQYNMNDIFLDDTKGSYLWLLKPTELNRGRGVRIFSELQSLRKMLKEYTQGYNQKALQSSTQAKSTFIKTESFVIQKYIEKPLLINKRKFDIRTWALVDSSCNVYFFREGYARLSSEEFDLSKNKMENVFVHLTNNAIQQHGENYCKFESGNQLSFKDIKELISRTNDNSNAFEQVIIPKMKEIVQALFKSVKGKLNKAANGFCMEIFGLDFFIDQQLGVWIIEVNTNPCIEESSPLLGQLIPRMLNDAFKLTVDVVFPKWLPLKETAKMKIVEQKIPVLNSKNKMSFSVNGYADEVNMWDYICNISVK